MKNLFSLFALSLFFVLSSASAFASDLDTNRIEFTIQTIKFEEPSQELEKKQVNNLHSLECISSFKANLKTNSNLKFQDRHRRQVLLNGIYIKY